MWIRQNENPLGRNVDDCAVRALAVATGKCWDRIYWEMAIAGNEIADMMHADKAWHHVLKNNGFKRRFLPEHCPDCYTVRDFCKEHPQGVYVVAVQDHVIACVSGNYVDTWDSGSESPLYFFSKE